MSKQDIILLICSYVDLFCKQGFRYSTTRDDNENLTYFQAKV